MAITQQIDLNMIPDQAPVIVHADQYDEGEGRLVINLFDRDKPYIPAPGATAVIQGTRPDGQKFSHEAVISDNMITADLFQDMTAVGGKVYIQAVITEGENRTGTTAFYLMVQKSGLPDNFGG